jgi:hypothetical protein
MKYLELYESESWQKSNRLNEDERQDILNNGVFTLDTVKNVTKYSYTEDEINQIIDSTLDGYDGMEEIIGMLQNTQDRESIKNAISQKDDVIKTLESFKIKWIKIR